jgi:hypothetical protein
MKKHFVGIDLGTTNCALAFVPAGSQSGETQPLELVQLVQPDQAAVRPLLPSFGYLPGEGEFPEGVGQLPWGPSSRPWVGEVARTLGARVPGRMISSAKSWLAHPKADPAAPLLPWQAPEGQIRISAVDASASYLSHMVDAWHQAHPGAKLSEQHVVITIPASFDDQARRHTLEAARKAGLAKASLLEEPLAAFYHFLSEHSGEAASFEPGMTVLVVDVGGGTTDFTLIEATSVEGELAWSRKAVGDHLLLGGDNMDRTLAHFAESKLNTRLDGSQLAQMIQACRSAKEALFSRSESNEATVTVTGRGRSLMAGTLSTKISRDDLNQVLLDGLFPACERTDLPVVSAKTGLIDAGLPYARDPAITRHLAAFLANQLPGEKGPDALLFNGGVFHASALRERIIHVLGRWYPQYETTAPLKVFVPGSLDLAVARGAAHFAWLKATGGKRVQGGSARSYYVALAEEPDSEGRQSLLCVLSRQSEEGVAVVLAKPELELTLGEPVRFALHSSTTRPKDKPGDLILAREGELLAQGDLQTRLRAGKSSASKTVTVHLAALPTEIGTLELELIGREANQAWKLEFNMRPASSSDIASSVGEPAAAPTGPIDIIDESQISPALELLSKVLSGDDREAAKSLIKSLEESLGQSRQDWPVSVCRRLWETLHQGSEGRKAGPEIFERWALLAGWCLRPGFGMAGDNFRMETLWKILYGPQAGKPREGGQAWWVMWRRVSGGLDEARQQGLMNRLRGVLLPVKGRTVVRPPTAELAEMWRLAASLERLDVATKTALAEPLLRLIRRPEAPDYAFWSLARLGTRRPIYGPVNSILPTRALESWVELLEGSLAANPGKLGQWTLLCTELIRPSGDRHLDLPEPQLARIESLLSAQGLKSAFDQARENTTDSETTRQANLLGDSLPLGLRLAGK